MNSKKPTVSPRKVLPHPVSLVYTIYRHGAGLSEEEALERARRTASQLAQSA